MTHDIPCPHCGEAVTMYRNPVPTVDIVVYDPNQGVLLIERKNEPFGWALPGGFVDYGESIEKAAVREAKEETNLDVTLTGLLGVYSDPERDARHHTMACVFTAMAHDLGALQAGDDAGAARFFALDDLPTLCFDHSKILADFISTLP